MSNAGTGILVAEPKVSNRLSCREKGEIDGYNGSLESADVFAQSGHWFKVSKINQLAIFRRRPALWRRRSSSS
jgi:hypothetical protein